MKEPYACWLGIPSGAVLEISSASVRREPTGADIFLRLVALKPSTSFSRDTKNLRRTSPEICRTARCQATEGIVALDF